MEQYPAVRFMVQHGAKLAVMVGISLPVLVLLGVLLSMAFIAIRIVVATIREL